MPKIDGFEVLTWLRSHVEFSRLPVVVLSGSIRREDQQEAVKLGAKAFHTKPMDATELNAILIAVPLGCRLLLSEPRNSGR